MNNIFRGGIPYGPDLRRLAECFPVPNLAEGLVIKHEDLEAILEVDRHGTRYRGVVNSWIGKLRAENGIILTWQPSIGIKVLDPAGVLEHAETRTRQKVRQLQRTVKLFGWVDRSRLDDTGKRRLDHEMISAAKMAQHAKDAEKEMAIELAPIKSMPKRIA